jgi:hypothetical protein
MKKTWLALLPVLVLTALLLAPQRALAAERVSVKDLTESAENYDGQTVTIEGEVIGDIMQRGDYAWITVNDDPYIALEAQEERLRAGFNIGIGVWLPSSEAEKVKVLGGYKNVGDRVSVTGVFHRVDGEHGGDTDIVAQSLVVLKPGQPVSRPLSLIRWIILAALAVSAISLWRIRRARIRAALGRQ